MKFPVIRESYILNIVILIVSLFVSWFILLFGIAHLIEATGGNNNPNVSDLVFILLFILLLGFIGIGIVFLLIAFASIQGIIYKIRNRKHN